MAKPRREPKAAWFAAETPQERLRRARTVLARLAREYPGARVALRFTSPFELLVATVLSAQCTDAKVNEVTPALFRRYPTPEDYLRSPPGELEEVIRPTGFYNQKAKALRGIARALVEEHDDDVPATMEELLQLPGVARKTANIVLSQAFGVIEGIAVDTHVHRLSRRLGFSDQEDPNKVERDLMGLFPRRRWPEVTTLLILHGREVCKAARPRCEDCVLADRCPSSRLPGVPGSTRVRGGR